MQRVSLPAILNEVLKIANKTRDTRATKTTNKQRRIFFNHLTDTAIEIFYLFVSSLHIFCWQFFSFTFLKVITMRLTSGMEKKKLITRSWGALESKLWTFDECRSKNEVANKNKWRTALGEHFVLRFLGIYFIRVTNFKKRRVGNRCFFSF